MQPEHTCEVVRDLASAAFEEGRADQRVETAAKALMLAEAERDDAARDTLTMLNKVTEMVGCNLQVQ